MLQASEDLEYELAAHYRDQIQSIDKVLQKQRMVTVEDVDRDAFGMYREGERLVIQIMFVRGGRLEGSRAFPFKDQAFPDEEILSSFINVYYNAGHDVPKEVLLPLELDAEEVAAFEELLGEMRDGRVYLKVPQRGPKYALVETANTNAEHTFRQKHEKAERVQDMLEKLQQRLGLRNYPERIECYDVSNFQGDPIVGSKVAFVDGEPNKQQYRHYRMKQVTSQDDFASMHELLTRRLRRVASGEDDAPDLIVIDGGKGQLGQAVAVLEDLGLHGIDVIGLAKSRVDKTGFDDDQVTRSPERVFLPGRKNPVVLKQNSAELYLLQRVRDEAHRSAITYQKKARRKRKLRSSLDEIEGVGPKTRRALLRHFGSLKKIKAADVDALCEVEGVGRSTAEAIHEFFA